MFACFKAEYQHQVAEAGFELLSQPRILGLQVCTTTMPAVVEKE